MEDNIVSLGFDTTGFNSDQKVVLAGLNQIYDVAAKIDGLKIAPNVDPSWKDLKAVIAAQAQEIKNLQQANVDYIKSQEAITKADTAIIKNAQEKEKLLQLEIKSRQALTNEFAKSQKAMEAEAGTIDRARQLIAQYTKERNATNTTTEAGVAKVKLLNSAIDAQNAFIAQNSASLEKQKQNVGNYSNSIVDAFGKIWSTIRIVAYALPGVGIAGIMDVIFQGIKKVADAMGIFSDKEVTKLIDKITQLNKAYIETIQLLQDFQKVMGPEDSQRLQNIENELKLSQASNKTKADQLLLEKQLLAEKKKQSDIAYKTEHGNTVPGDIISAANDPFLLAGGKLASAEKNYEQFLMRRSKLKKDYDKEDLDKQQEQLKLTYDLAKINFEKQKQIIDDYHKNNTDAAAKDLEIQAYFSAEQRKLNLFNAISAAEIKKDADARLLSLDKATQADKLKAIQDTATQEKAIAEAQNRNVQSDSAASANDKKIAAQTLANKILIIDKNAADQQYKLNEDYRKRDQTARQARFESNLALQEMYNRLTLENELAGIKDKLKAFDDNAAMQADRENARYKIEKDKKGLTDAELENIEQQHQNNLASISLKATTDRLKLVSELEINEAKKAGSEQENTNIQYLIRDYENLALNLQDKKITYTQFVKEKERLDRNYADNALADQLSVLEKEKSILEKGLKDTTDIENQIAAIKKQQKEKQLANTADTSKKEFDIRKQQADKEKELAFATLDLLNTVFTAQYENEKNRIQSLIDLSDERYSKEIANIQASTLSEQDKAAKIKILEADQAAQRRKYEAEIREQNIKKAKADRAFQIFQIAGNTAIGITSALAQFPPNPILAAIIGAIGAVQIAKVLATPIPKYAAGAGVNGRPKHPGGIAEYGEAGPERVDLPGGQSFIADSRTVGYLPPDTVITPLTDKEVNEAMYNGAMRLQAARLSGDTAQVDQAWAIARWQSGQTVGAIKQLAKRPVVARFGSGGASASYINQIFGRS